jgi:hypothetical protein
MIASGGISSAIHAVATVLGVEHSSVEEPVF